jgi:hypothetical protein
VGDDDVGQPGRVQDLGHGAAHVVVHRVRAGVDERGPLVLDEELVTVMGESEAMLLIR